MLARIQNQQHKSPISGPSALSVALKKTQIAGPAEPAAELMGEIYTRLNQIPDLEARAEVAFLIGLELLQTVPRWMRGRLSERYKHLHALAEMVAGRQFASPVLLIQADISLIGGRAPP